MAVSRYGKGDLCGITVMPESEYGVTSTAEGATSVHMGVMTALKVDEGVETEESVNCGSRKQGVLHLVKKDIVASVDFKVSRDAAWYDWLTWVLGGSSLSGTPSSKTVCLKIATSSVDTLLGATVNQLTITSEELGAPLKFNAEIYAKSYQIEDVGRTASLISTGTPIRCTSQWTLDGTAVPSGDWELTICQNLEKVAGASSEGYTLASGQEPYLGSPQVRLEITVPARSRAYDEMKEEVESTHTLAVTIGAKTVTLSGCYLAADAPQRSESTYDETLAFTATNITVS